MQVSITGRHFEITDAIRDHATARLERVREHFDRVIDAQVILSVEKHRHIAEINLHVNGHHINAKETSEDMYLSIDSSVDKIERQVEKYKGRIQRHQPRTAREGRGHEPILDANEVLAEENP